MRVIEYVTCSRCGTTESLQGLDAETARAVATQAHVCVDGGGSEAFTFRTENVPGIGERGRDNTESK